MVQIVENWASIAGTIISCTAGGDAGTLVLRVERLDPVPGFAMVLTQRPDDVVAVRTRPGQLAEADCPAGARGCRQDWGRATGRG